MKIFKVMFLAVVMALFAGNMAMSAGFDEFGYNRKAGIFVGTYTEWYAARDRLVQGHIVMINWS